MMLKTHLALNALIALLFLPHITGKTVFLLIIFAATIIPDIDTGFSTAGKNIAFRPLQFFVKHRGLFHSFTFAIIASLILAYFWPLASLAFFLGYGFHLFLDSFTQEGIMPFWPWRKVSSGIFRTGGKIETSLFVMLLILDLVALVMYVARF
jgi:membrane-bound metal-dependent hydrolase YbcI (DUF457 family)